MKKNRAVILVCIPLCFLLLFGYAGAASAARSPSSERQQRSVTWVKRDGNFYAYDAVTGKLLRSRRVGRYYTKKNGSRVRNAFRKGTYYNWKGRRTGFRGGFIRADGKLYYFRNRKKVKGFVRIGKHQYFFDRSGAAITGTMIVCGKWRLFRKNGRMVRKSGWIRFDGKRFYIRKNGVLKEGFFKKNGKTYYQSADAGVWTGLREIGEKKYVFDPDGVLNDALTVRARTQAHPVSAGSPSDLLFFTRYESGNASYRQTGGDGGKAYGKYQFDYRYSLTDLLRFCYQKDPVLFAEFRVFIYLKPGDTRLLKGNRKAIPEAGLDPEKEPPSSWDLADAWNTVWNRNADAFASCQDLFARERYSLPVEKSLAAKGIHMNTRTYVERGALFSYAIQEGGGAAASAVVSCGITDATSSRDFLNLLYDYRWTDSNGWNRDIRYAYRYQAEKEQALSILTALGG